MIEPTNGHSTSVRSFMVADHDHLEKVLSRVVSAFEEGDREEVARVWSEFDRALLAHLEAEERHLLPPLMRARPRSANAILREHKMIRDRLTELGAGVDLHVVRLDTAREFIDELRAHARHEEKVFYPWADEHVEDSIRKTLLAAFVDAVV
jgi:hemerythrin-like domain-containing protein